jgi:hypothetical protein
MRAAIKARLAAELTALSGRCYDIQEPSGTTVKPYATVKLNGQTPENVWTGVKRVYEVALYGEPGDGNVMDALADQAALALHGVQLPGGPSGPAFTCRLEGVAEPEITDGGGAPASIRTLRLAVAAVGTGEAASSASADEALEALCVWTEEKAGGGWQVYRQQWPQAYTAPAILWRLEQVEAQNRSASMIELHRTVIGHVVSQDEAEQAAMVGALASGLGGVTKLEANPATQEYVVPGTVIGDYRADGLTTGQLTVALRQKVRKAAPTGPLIREVHYDGGFR